MKLIIAIVNKDDAGAACDALTDARFYVTRLATTGGFLRAGNVTLLTGVADEKVDRVIGLIRENASSREEAVPTSVNYGESISSGRPVNVTVGGATIFVTDVERFEKL